MNIERVDKNFLKTAVRTSNKIRYTIPCDGFDLYGIFYDEKRRKFMRMDGDVAEGINEELFYLATNTSGGRIRFSTNSSVIGISVTYSVFGEMPHMPLTGSCGFALLEKVGREYKTVSVFRPNHSEKSGYTGEVIVGDKRKREYILYFPLYNEITSLNIFLDNDSELFKAERYKDIKPILYYGSSIDQGGCASRPDSTFPATISKWNDIDFVNLGFSGNAKGEPEIADYLSTIDSDMLVMGYDGNAPDVDFLERTHFNFYKTYRK